MSRDPQGRMQPRRGKIQPDLQGGPLGGGGWRWGWLSTLGGKHPFPFSVLSAFLLLILFLFEVLNLLVGPLQKT